LPIPADTARAADEQDEVAFAGKHASARRFAREGSVLAPIRVRRTAPGIAEASAPEPARVREGHYRWTLAIADALVAAGVLLLLDALRGEIAFPWAAVAAMPAIVVLNKVTGLYGRDDLVINKTTLDEAPALLQVSALFAFSTWVIGDALIDGSFSATEGAYLWLVTFALLLAGRTLARAVARRWSADERCLLIGDAETLGTLRNKLQANTGTTVAASVPLTDDRQLTELVQGTDEFRDLVRSTDVHRIVIAPMSHDAGGDTLELVRMAKAVGTRVSVVPRLFEVIGSSVEFDQVDGLVVLAIRRFGLSRSSRLLKRAFDLAVGTACLVAVVPFMVAVATAIRIDSAGPLFFRQVRVGRDGQRFTMLKFRSMVADAESRKEALRPLNGTAGLFKLRGDPRITRVGRFIRATSLDELPQLVNVWRGEMSLVGPRPLVVDEDARVGGNHRSRLHLTPGMTGPWQILGSARVPLDEMVGIDYLYVANWSLWTDVKILMRTVPHVLRRGGM